MPLKLVRKVTHNWHVKLVSAALAVLLWFYVGSLKEKERFLTAPFEVRNVAQGYMVSSDTPSYVKIVLRGSESALALVDEGRIKAYVDMDLRKRGRMRGVVSIEKRGVPPGVSVREISPRYVDLTVEDLVVRQVEVSPVIVGKPAEGFVIGNVTVEPGSVRVRGPSTSVGGLSALFTETVSVEGLAETAVREARVRLEPGKVSLVDGGPLRVTILVEEEYVVRRFESLPIEVRNLREEFTAAVSPSTASALVKIPMKSEGTLPHGALRAYVDAGGVERPGTQKLVLHAETDLGYVSILGLEPEYVGLSAEAAKRRRR